MCEVFKVVRKASGRLQEVFVGMTEDVSASVLRGTHPVTTQGQIRAPGSAPRQICKGIRRPKYEMFFGGTRVK